MKCKIPMHDDSLNADLVEALVAFARGFEEQIGRKPTAEEFSQTLTLVVQTTNESLFDDVSNPQLKAIEFKFAKRIPNFDLKIGDVFYFKSEKRKDKCIFLAFLGQIKPYGDIFISFRGLHDANAKVDDLIPFPFTFVSSNKNIHLGKWKFAGNRSDLQSKHKIYPEVYLNKAFYKNREDIGPYGCALRLNADGALTQRQLSQEEARQIGIFENRNDMVCQPEDVECFIMSRDWI